MSRDEWAEYNERAAIGDRLVTDVNFGRGLQVYVVTKITATQIVCAEGRVETRFQRRGGKVVGSSGYHVRFGRPMTPEREAALRSQASKSWAKYEAAGALYSLKPLQIEQVRELTERLHAENKASEVPQC